VLFWKVMFFITLSSAVIGAIEVAGGSSLGPGHLLNLLSALETGFFWWLCRRGNRSLGFSRFMEGEAFVLHAVIGAPLVRYAAAQFLVDRGLITKEGVLMGDGLFLMMAQGGSAMLVAIRAALVPSTPQRTAWVSAWYGVPFLLAIAFLAPSGSSELTTRPLDAEFAWLLGMSVMMWVYAIITCTVISSVIYGLRSEVWEAQQLGQYTLGKKLGEGGMGQVFEAQHGMMRRPSAIKLLKPGEATESSLRRFEHEVQMTARLTHPSNITIFDYGRTRKNVFYYAMELLEGATLQQIVEVGGPLPEGRVTRILDMACGALSEAHDSGLIHRDIKPANIMLCLQGGELDVVKLLDFGLVKDLGMGSDVQLTQADTITGTPQYMAPEAIREASASDARSDIYALGAVAYFLLAGQPLFDGKTVVEICGQHLHEEPRPLSARGQTIDPDLEALVMACLRKEPEARPQSASELRDRLADCSVTPWTAGDARDWWDRYGPQLEGTKEPSTAHGATLAIDAHRQVEP
jgi:serine/threonine-protein kinase